MIQTEQIWLFPKTKIQASLGKYPFTALTPIPGVLDWFHWSIRDQKLAQGLFGWVIMHDWSEHVNKTVNTEDL